MSIKDGGPAFPNNASDAWGGPVEGMLLRDWFAGQAVLGALIQFGDDDATLQENAKIAAIAAYADAAPHDAGYVAGWNAGRDAAKEAAAIAANRRVQLMESQGKKDRMFEALMVRDLVDDAIRALTPPTQEADHE